MMGPPAVAPNWFCRNGPRGCARAIVGPGIGVQILVLQVFKQAAVERLVPDFSFTLITPPAARPYSAL